MPLLFMSHKLLYLALCSTHSVLIFDNYIMPMVPILIFSADFPQISFCISLTIISKLMLSTRLQISQFLSNLPPLRNLDLLLLPIWQPHCLSYSGSEFSLTFSLLSYSFTCQTLFCFWKVIHHFLLPLSAGFITFSSMYISLCWALFLNAQHSLSCALPLVLCFNVEIWL